jgi:hypothetical protein
MEYDAGQTADALQIARRLRGLFHDTGKSVSATQSVDIKRVLRLYDSGMYEVTRGMAHSALTRGYRDTYLPCFDDFMDDGTRIFLPFERWWARKVMSDAEGHKFSRRKLILGLADEEGGAHMTPDGGFGAGPWQPSGSAVSAAMREMGYEALVSFAQSFPETFGDDQLVLYYKELRRTVPPGRNKPCHCGSGLKFKMCCGQ